jgi:glucose-6-phosphate dehydrogenase assembly protein OpcA
MEAAMNATLVGPRSVSVAGIDKELQAIWKTLAPPTLAEAAPIMQASVVNFVALVEGDAAADAITELITQLVDRTPCRFILLNSQPEADPPALDASVSVIRHRQVCCELIRLNATGILADTLPATAQAFYTPDLPIMLWWSAPLNRPDLFPFADSVDRLVFDSLRYRRDDLTRVVDLVSESRRMRTAVSDLNWARLTPYRQLFAQFFDAPNCRGYLHTIETATIEACESAGLLMKGWLLSRLNRWPHAITREQIQLHISPGDGPAFQSITLNSGSAEFSLRRASNDTVEASETIDGETVSRVVRVPALSLEKLLEDEIIRSGRDRAYDAAVTASVAGSDSPRKDTAHRIAP